jgi:flagellar basal body P-ring protein FlgI
MDPANRGGTKLGQLMRALEQMKVPAVDRIAIIKNLHKLGGLHAQLILE